MQGNEIFPEKRIEGRIPGTSQFTKAKAKQEQNAPTQQRIEPDFKGKGRTETRSGVNEFQSVQNDVDSSENHRSVDFKKNNENSKIRNTKIKHKSETEVDQLEFDWQESDVVLHQLPRQDQTGQGTSEEHPQTQNRLFSWIRSQFLPEKRTEGTAVHPRNDPTVCQQIHQIQNFSN